MMSLAFPDVDVNGSGAIPTQFYGGPGERTPPSGTHSAQHTPQRHQANLMFPSQLEYNSSLHPETAQMFQTITSTLNEIQVKLSTIQNQYTQQDAHLKILENSLEKISDQGKGVSRPTVKSRKVPVD